MVPVSSVVIASWNALYAERPSKNASYFIDGAIPNGMSLSSRALHSFTRRGHILARLDWSAHNVGNLSYQCNDFPLQSFILSTFSITQLALKVSQLPDMRTLERPSNEGILMVHSLVTRWTLTYNPFAVYYRTSLPLLCTK